MFEGAIPTWTQFSEILHGSCYTHNDDVWKVWR